MAEMMAQSLNNLNNPVRNQSSQSTKKSKKSKEKDDLAALVNENEKAKKTFKQLLQENDSKKADNSEKVDFSKLLDILNLSKDDLKQKIKNMDSKEIKDLEKMVQVALASILEKLNSEQKIKNLEEFGISKDLLNKVKSKLGFMQQLINKQKENLEILNNNSNNQNSPPDGENKTVDSASANDSKLSKNNKSSKSNNSNKVINSGKNSSDNNSSAKVASKEISAGSANKTTNNSGENLAKNQNENKVMNNAEKILSQMNVDNKENMSKAEKVYYQTLKKQANAENNQAKKVSVGLKDKGKNLAASQLNSELKANLDFKELSKKSDLQKLLNKENLNTAENKIKTTTNNTKQDSSFSNLFSGNQQENNFAQLFGTQNMTDSSNIGSGENTPQFSSSVLQGTELAKQVTEQIKLLNKPANNEIKLQLEPDFLGKVKMDLKVDGGKVTARFMVDNMLVKNHLDQNISHLKSTLINQGFNVDNLEVNAEDGSYDMGREDGSNQFFQGENQKQNQRQFSYHEYEKLKDELLDLSPEELEKIVENDPEKLRNWGYGRQNDWFSYGGYYQRMNLLA
ncbi:MAG: flagellar hook-length control protein FliK [Bacillota bacterium]